MDEVKISKEKMDYTIDLLITLTVSEIVKETGHDRKSVLLDFMRSKTGRFLYDVNSRLWWNGPAYLADMYAQEKKVKQ